MTNIVQAPSIIAVQPGIVMTTTGGFAQSLLTRLAGTHEAELVASRARVQEEAARTLILECSC